MCFLLILITLATALPLKKEKKTNKETALLVSYT